ncbi:hypothetical protein A6R68_22978, partial [Neotoma lepida]
MDILSALVTRLQDRFKAQIGTVLPSLIDRLGDAKDSVREQDQTLLLKIMDQAANPQGRKLVDCLPAVAAVALDPCSNLQDYAVHLRPLFYINYNHAPTEWPHHTHIPRLIPVITSNCTSKSVAVRRCYWGFHSHFSREAEHLYHTLESSYQKALQSHLKNSDSIVSLPQSDRSSSSSQESLNRPLSAKRSPTGSTTSRGSLQRSRSDIDVNAAASAKSKVSSSSGSTAFSSAAALPPGSYASLGRIRTRRQSSGSATNVASTPSDSRGRSRAKVVSQSQ